MLKFLFFILWNSDNSITKSKLKLYFIYWIVLHREIWFVIHNFFYAYIPFFILLSLSLFWWRNNICGASNSHVPSELKKGCIWLLIVVILSFEIPKECHGTFQLWQIFFFRLWHRHTIDMLFKLAELKFNLFVFHLLLYS